MHNFIINLLIYTDVNNDKQLFYHNDKIYNTFSYKFCIAN